MTAPYLTPGHHYPVSAFNKGLKQHIDINLPGTGQAYYSDICRILLPHGAGQIRRGKRAVVTAESDYMWFIAHIYFPEYLL
jgi:hypothetical protein